MKTLLHGIVLLLVLLPFPAIFAQDISGREYSLSSYNPAADGVIDDTEALRRLFQDVKEKGGGVVTIPPGDYYLKAEHPVPIPSNTTVFAYGATFSFSESLGDQARVVMFQDADVTNFSWFGGFFKGNVFDPQSQTNTWTPNANTRVFVINTTENGTTDQLKFRDIRSERVAGAVINVNGYSPKWDATENLTFATNVSVENCTLLNSGKFMWDYGLLWQIIVYPEDYSQAEIDMAYKYFDTKLIYDNVRLKGGDDRVFIQNINKASSDDAKIEVGRELCFYNDMLPKNIIRGKRYYIVEVNQKFVKISDVPDGPPIVFDGTAGPKTRIINNVRKAFFQYAPIGAGPGKGCIDLTVCKNTLITGCNISALGDAMHVQTSHNNIFANNHILGARMGAFFLAHHCKNSTVIGNTVDGTNGSRTMSIERSNEDVTVIGNVFRNGGRGSWINQPKNIIIQGNIFISNTTKGEKDPKRGRRDFRTGGWQSYPEIYFTTYQKDGKYGPVILKDNIFFTGPEAAAVIQFEKNGFDVQVEGNIVKGSTGVIMMDENDKSITIRNNSGFEVKKGSEYSKSLFKNE